MNTNEQRLAKALRNLVEVTKPYWVLPRVKPSYDQALAALREVDAQVWRESVNQKA